MADTPSNATNAYGEGIKWILAISAAAVGGAFIHLKELEDQSIWVQALLALSLGLFVYSTWCGMYSLIWLNTAAMARDRRREYREEIEKMRVSPCAGDEASTAYESKVKDDLAEVSKTIEDAKRDIAPYYRHHTRSFSLALFCAAGGLLLAMLLKIVAPKIAIDKIAPVAPVGKVHYSLVPSAVHATVRGREAHTFLMNDDTGELWQMICAGDGLVAFRKVVRIEAK